MEKKCKQKRNPGAALSICLTSPFKDSATFKGDSLTVMQSPLANARF